MSEYLISAEIAAWQAKQTPSTLEESVRVASEFLNKHIQEVTKVGKTSFYTIIPQVSMKYSQELHPIIIRLIQESGYANVRCYITPVLHNSIHICDEISCYFNVPSELL